MKRRTNQKEKIRLEQDPIPWRYCLLTLVCGLLLVVGFFWAARQHFSAMDLGMKNAELRKQKENLESERRLLERNREVSLAPTEIKKVAKKFGLQELTADSVELISSVKDAVIPSEAPTKTKSSKSDKTEKIATEKKTEKIATENKDDEPKSQIPTDLRERIAKAK